MSDFKLDINYPYEIIKKEDLYSRPPRIHYGNARDICRHYGKIIEQMIYKANGLEEGEEKNYLIYLIANQMKRSYVVWNKDTVEDGKIFLDLYELSERRIKLDESMMKLVDSREILASNAPVVTPKVNINKKNHNRKNR
jgi:hypothetical protein